MSERIIRNDINDSKEDIIVLQYLKDFKAKKCLYCFQSDPKFLCQCKECDYYFCNNIHRKTSHAVLHLKQCKHKRISLSPFDSEIMCKSCRCKDIFKLYYKEGKILCEECLEGINKNNNYLKIIENKKIIEEILISPEIPPLANRIDSYSESLITKINNKIILLKSYDPYTVSLNYTKKKNYCLRYNTLLEIEISEIEKKNMEEDSFTFELKFNIKDNTYITAEIKKNNQEFCFYPRQLLIVSKLMNENKSFLARVIDVDKSKKNITIFFKDLEKHLCDGLYNIKEKYSTANYKRMIEGLDILKRKDSLLLNKNILLLIIGKEIKEGKEKLSNVNEYLDQALLPNKLRIAKLENINLNKSQEIAIKNCFKHKLTLIKGPPGTGKSTVLLFLTYHLLKLRKSSNDKIFIGAPSNRAVDNISFLLQKLEIPFVRVLSLEKEISDDVDKTNSLEDLIQKEIEKELEKNNKKKKFQELIEKRAKYGFLKGEDIKLYNKIMDLYQTKVLNSSPIVLSTINNSADSRISNYDFPIVIIDEATQALEPDCLLPLYHKAQMVILIGDEKQLGPTAISHQSEISGLGISLFERLCFYYKGSDFITILNEQYRAHKALYEFSNKHFYNNEIITNCENKLDENVKNNFPWPNKDIPMLFINIREFEKKENCSYYNDTEINYIYDIVKKLIKAKVDVKNIGIITPYNAQKYKLYDRFFSDEYENLRIESVDGFQGMEKEYIIISTVRSNLKGKIGFLSLYKRLNVALTRAKKGVIILGNAECLAKKKGIWKELIYFYLNKKLIVKGNLNHLQLVEKNEIFGNNCDSDDDEEEDEELEEISELVNKEKDENKKNDVDDSYFKIWEPAPCADEEEIEYEDFDYDIYNKSSQSEEKEEKEEEKEEIKSEEDNSFKEEKEEIKDSKRKKKKNKNKKKNNAESSEEEDKKEIDPLKSNNNNKKKKKNKYFTNKNEDKKETKRINKKGNKNNSNDSSSDKSEDKKDKKKSKRKKK